MFKNPFFKSLKLFWQRGPIGYCFVICFVSVPFHFWLANLGHVIILLIATVLLAHGGSEDIEVFRISPFIAPCTRQHRWPKHVACNGTHHNNVRASAYVTFPFTVFFVMRLWNDCNCFICVVRPGWSLQMINSVPLNFYGYVQDWRLMRFKFLMISITRCPHWQKVTKAYTILSNME